MTTKLSADNFQTSTLTSFGSGRPRITTITVTNSSYQGTGANTVSTSGGYAIIDGNYFISGCQVIIDQTAATAVAFVSSSRLNVQLSAKSAGSYSVYVINPDGGTALRAAGITYA